MSNVDQEKVTRINTTMRRDLEIKLRKKAYKKYGLSKGAIKRALEEAVDEWLKEK
jgi:hypothetical protein